MMAKNQSKVAFVGLGNMGVPMALNLQAAGFAVQGYDVFEAACAKAQKAGLETAASLPAVLAGTSSVITALPAAQHVRDVYLGDEGLLHHAPPDTLFIDCSTIDVATARAVIGAAAEAGHTMVDSPMSGGVPGAEGGKLTFMVGGSEAGFERARPILDVMGANIFYAGVAGSGCAAKICNNMLLGISMIGVSEAFNLAEQLGLEAETLYRISSTATGRCWSLNDYCPAPGPVPSAPSCRDYRPGFAAALMLKDLRLAMDVAPRRGRGDTAWGAGRPSLRHDGSRRHERSRLFGRDPFSCRARPARRRRQGLKNGGEFSSFLEHNAASGSP